IRMRPDFAPLLRTSMYQPSFFFFGKIGGLPIFLLIYGLFRPFLICNRKGTNFVPNCRIALGISYLTLVDERRFNGKLSGLANVRLILLNLTSLWQARLTMCSYPS